MAKKSNKTFPLEDILQTEIKSLQDCMFQMSHVDRSIFLKMFLSCETLLLLYYYIIILLYIIIFLTI